ncbi:hypothetical protein [Rossellomorea marisflavi]|uniref:hypothetical protein n=1 Tax=Rossellomorea marisflavi TaxID=189381 RepID=UPI003F9F1B39
MINTLDLYDKEDLLDEDELVDFLIGQRHLGNNISAQKVHDILFLSYAWLKYYFPDVCNMVFPTPPQWAFTGFIFPDTVKKWGIPKTDTPYRESLSLSFEILRINMDLKRVADGEYGEIINLLMEKVETDWIRESDEELSHRIMVTDAWLMGLSEFNQDSILFNPILEGDLMEYLKDVDNRMELFGFHVYPSLESQLIPFTKEEEWKGLLSHREPLFTIEELMLYVLEYSLENKYELSPMKLNKVLFMLNAKSIQKHQIQLVNGFEKGRLGPIHPAVQKHYGYYGYMNIQRSSFKPFTSGEEEARASFHTKVSHSIYISKLEINEIIETFVHEDKWELTDTCIEHPSWKKDKPLPGAELYARYELDELVDDILNFKDFFTIRRKEEN